MSKRQSATGREERGPGDARAAPRAAHRRPREQRDSRPQPPPLPSAGQRPLALDLAAALPEVVLPAVTRATLIYRKRVTRALHARGGDLVAVYGPEERLLGYGLYNPRSEIAVRMLTRGAALPDVAFWREQLNGALALRRDLLRLDEATDACRLVHAEADGLSGLVVDRYGDVLSAEVFSLGMYQRAEALLELLQTLCGTSHWVCRSSPQFLAQEGADAPTLSSPAAPRETIVQEYGTRFRIRFEDAHKTGFFCDQRDNRRRLAELCRDRSVLDLCCYTGGFAVQAKRLGKAREVTAVDLDEKAIEVAKENANLNQARIRFVQADAFTFMRDLIESNRRFDVVVLDPPKLIRTRLELEEGTRKHHDLNRLAMRLVAPGGLLLSCTCSGLLSDDEFRRLLVSAARQAGAVEGVTEGGRPRHLPRAMQILGRSGAAADHPVAAEVPESEYLKAYWMRLT